MISSSCSRLRFASVLAIFSLAAVGCGDSESAGRYAIPIHLEDRLDTAEIVGAEVSMDSVARLRWDLGRDEGADRAVWNVLPSMVDGGTPARVEATDEGLRVRLTEKSFSPMDGYLYGGVYVEVQDFDPSVWSHVLIRARATAAGDLGIAYNVREAPGDKPDDRWPTTIWGSDEEVIPDGEVHVYRMPLRERGGPLTEEVHQISLEFGAGEPSAIELLSVELEAAITEYAGSGVGVRSVSATAHEDFGPQRRALYVHSPARVSFPLRVPPSGRLDLALGTFFNVARMSVHVDHGDSTATLLDETVPPKEAWRQRSVDLSKWSGRDVTLTLAAEAPSAEVPVGGTGPAIAYWASPTVSGLESGRGSGQAKRPNVLFYVIDGASANLMSVYGYERDTTPNLTKIAAEGVVFEQAHSNSTWTMPSTASFMTSLHHSVLGGLRNDANPVPPNVKTMAEHFHDAGFHTGVFTFNPNAGGFSGLDRAVDVFRDFGKRGAPMDPIEAISSRILHEQFWQWREAYPGPYWVHFQTTDVHPPHHPQDPFKGRYAPAERTAAVAKQMQGLRFPFNHTSASVHEHWQEQLAQNDIDPQEFYGTMLDAHDEAMLHQDHYLGELVDRLKKSGEWENTLLVIASDHGHPAASYPRFGRGLLDPQPPAWEGALLGEFESHVPLIFVWPGRIEGGRRIEAPVSMIDVLPTLLDLVGLPQPEIAQGQSLSSLLLNESDRENRWRPRPVVFDEFRMADDGSMVGNLEILDGRWGRSLEIRTGDALPPPSTGRHPAPAGGRWKALPFEDVPRLLIYDVEADPRAVEHVTDPAADLLAESERMLWRLWKEHRALAEKFEAGEEADLSAQQLEALQALGYLQ